ncbi:TPA: hypothetical protein NJ443_003696 [Vibrio parahaemolyticus]|nr:hypothetical protein [Vibrio parahaemolyticus]
MPAQVSIANEVRAAKKPYIGLWGNVLAQTECAMNKIKHLPVSQLQELQSVHQDQLQALQSLLVELEANLQESLNDTEK